jgi:beta-mannosidase
VAPAIPGGPRLRKAPPQFGWDWGPQLPAIGIWKDIRLDGRSVARLDDVHVRQRHEDDQVTVEAVLTVDRWQDVPLTSRVRVTDPDGATLEEQADIVDASQALQVSITQPRLGWPNGHGDRPLYTVDIPLLSEGQMYDHRTYQMGLRTV